MYSILFVSQYVLPMAPLTLVCKTHFLNKTHCFVDISVCRTLFFHRLQKQYIFFFPPAGLFIVSLVLVAKVFFILFF